MWVAMQANQLALVLTDRRFLLIQVDSKGRARDIKNQIRLSEIRRVKNRGIFGSYWQIETLDKKKLGITSLPKRDRRALEALCPAQPNAAATAGPSLEHLCPACLRVVPGKVGTTEVCPNEACRIPFRSPKKTARLSALIPGVGDLYLRHYLFGAIEFVGSMAMLAVAISMGLVAFLSNDSESTIVGLTALFLVVAPRKGSRRCWKGKRKRPGHTSIVRWSSSAPCQGPRSPGPGASRCWSSRATCSHHRPRTRTWRQPCAWWKWRRSCPTWTRA